MADSIQYVLTIQSRKKKSSAASLKPPKGGGPWTLHSWQIDGRKIAVVWQARTTEKRPTVKAKPASKRARRVATTASKGE